MKNIYKKIILLFAIVILFFVILELFFSILEKSNVISYDNYFKETTYNFGSEYFHFDDDLGLVNNNLLRINSNKTFKTNIFVLGDSVTAGFCVNNSYVNKLNRMSNLSQTRFFNLAVSGYNTFQEYAVLEKTTSDPDIVILQFFYNDFINSDIFVNQSGNMIRIVNANYDHSSKVLVDNFISSNIFKVIYSFFVSNNPCFGYSLNDNCFAHTSPIVYNYLNKIVDIVDSRNSKLILLYVPLEKEINGVRTYDNYENQYARHFIEDFSKEHNISLVDISDDFLGFDLDTGKAEYCNPVDHHPNDLGHKIIAQKLHEELLKLDII